MESTILFDVSTKPFDWEFLRAPIVLLVCACACILCEKLRWGNTAIKHIGYYLAAGTILFVGISYSNAYASTQENKSALVRGDYKAIQGTVEHFRPMYFEGRRDESFTIAGHTFSYSDFVSTSCFNTPLAHGGPIRAGLFLRVTYSDQCILRIEMPAEHAS